MWSVETPIAVPTSTAVRAPASRDEHLEQAPRLGIDDRDAVALAVGDHLGQHRVGLGNERPQIALEAFGEDHVG